jgi:transcriptional regulator of acetoin/glycerol metabolism
MPDTREAVSKALERNCERRGRLAAETRAARAELRELLARGSALALDVTEMARLAGISRETAHKRLREAKEGHDG